jgi:hypothetical protein
MLSPEPTLLMSAIGPNETRHSSLLNWSIWFFFVSSRSFWLPIRFLCEHILVTPLGNQLIQP